jgi:hypothetical protein
VRDGVSGRYRLQREGVPALAGVGDPGVDDLEPALDALFLRTRKDWYLGRVEPGAIQIVAFRGRQGRPKIPGLSSRIADGVSRSSATSSTRISAAWPGRCTISAVASWRPSASRPRTAPSTLSASGSSRPYWTGGHVQALAGDPRDLASRGPGCLGLRSIDERNAFVTQGDYNHRAVVAHKSHHRKTAPPTRGKDGS